MLGLREREIRRLVMEEKDQNKKEQCFSVFDDVKGKPKTQLQQVYLLRSKTKLANEQKLKPAAPRTEKKRFTSPSPNRYSRGVRVSN